MKQDYSATGMFIPIHEEILQHAGHSPDELAIVHGGEQIDFSGLERWTSGLAAQLIEAGACRGVVVGLNLQPSIRMAVTVLAILRTGAAYIPLSAAFPAERIRYILQDAGASLLIAEPGAEASMCPPGTALFHPDWTEASRCTHGNALLDQDSTEASIGPHGTPPLHPAMTEAARLSAKARPAARPIEPGDLAYIMYTSGSTGNPKGVMIEHRNLSYYVHWFYGKVMPQTGVALPLTSSFIFAAAVTQFYSTLLAGTTLHILDPMLIRQPAALMRWYSEHPGTGLYCVPTLWSEILRFLNSADGRAPGVEPPTAVCLSGEAVTGELLQATFERLPGLQLWNLYGPTEATANITACRLHPGEKPHIGNPLEGTRVFIVDENLKPVMPGDTGELLACGNGIARGYVNLPELTSKTFINATVDWGDNLRLYRSGDLAREIAPGCFSYVGRRDQQVKIRGFRIELPEVEHALLTLKEIRLAVVKAVEDHRAGKRLVGYVTFHDNEAMPVNGLRAKLVNILPDFMIPEIFVRLDHFPMLPNGKIDRKSLPLPGTLRPDLGYPAVAPVTAAEKIMVRAWEDVLGTEGIGMQDNFFDLGGNSLKAGSLALGIGSKMGVAVSLKSVFENLTPASLLSWVSGLPGFRSDNQHTLLQAPAVAPNLPNLNQFESVLAEPANIFLERLNAPDHPTRTEPPNIIPESLIAPVDAALTKPANILSESQKSLWFLHQAQPGLSAYNIFYSLHIDGPLDVACLSNALQWLSVKHPGIMARFRLGKSSVIEKFLVQSGELLETRGPGAIPSSLNDEDALKMARAEASKPFDLATDRLCRFILFNLGTNRHLLAVIVHHIVFDGLSFGVLMGDLRNFYAMACEGSSPLLKPDTSDQLFCHDETDYLSGKDYLADRAYWNHRLADVPAFFEIPCDFTRPVGFSQEGGQVRVNLDPMLRARLKQLANRCGSSMYMTCLAAFSVLLYRHSGRTDFLIGTPVANRNRREFSGAIGYFVNTMLFRARPDPSMAFSSWLASVREQILDGLVHARFPLNHMGVAMKADRIPGINPFFQVMFAYHEADWTFEAGSDLLASGREEFTGLSKFDLYTEIFSSLSGAEVVFTYSASLYSHETMEMLAGHFVEILKHAASQPSVKLSSINLMPAVEYQKVVYGWNDTLHPTGPEKTLPELVWSQIVKTPGAKALVSRRSSYNYAEMGERAIAIAGRLRQFGLQKGDPVGVHLENSPEMVIFILAIFLAGGVYVPLDPYYPEERLRYVIQKTGVNILVSDEVKPALKEEFPGMVMTTAELLAAETSPGPAVFGAGPADLAYIIFTSGSTGNPKGVMIRHDSLHNFLVWIGSELSVTVSDTFLSTTSINFDISLFELFTPLTRGASVVLEKRSELQAPEKVETIIREMEVNTIQFVPSGLKALCDSGVPSRIKSLKTIISGGERLSKTLQDQIFSQSGADLINLYGPTEATVYMAGWRCVRNSPMRTVPIGRPIFNAALYILDEGMKPVPIGVPGEAYVGGMVLSEGYFGDEAQTASRFLPDPFSAKPGARIYRVGDLCRFLSDGSVEFLGRTDHQVKVRGFRIELGEVEATILRFPGVRRVIVDAHEHGDDDIRLTAFMVPEPGASVREAELREFLRLHLPSYMIPGHFLTAPAIPTLPNGKTDRKALMSLRPALHTIPPPVSSQLNETELQIKSIWKELLGHEAFTIDDNFFEVGGHSLLLVRMKDLATEKMGAALSIVELFQYPTIRSLAAFLRKEKPVHDHNDITRRAAMRNKSIRQQISKRIFPGNKLT